MIVEIKSDDSYRDIEKRILLMVYESQNYNTVRTARRLKMAPSTLIRRLRTFGIEPKKSRGNPGYYERTVT